MTEKHENRCWPGYEPVKGKRPHSQGSCKPKAESKLTPSEKEFRTKRKRQLDVWQEKHFDMPRSAAQHLGAPGRKNKNANGKPAQRKGSDRKKARDGDRKGAKT